MLRCCAAALVVTIAAAAAACGDSSDGAADPAARITELEARLAEQSQRLAELERELELATASTAPTSVPPGPASTSQPESTTSAAPPATPTTAASAELRFDGLGPVPFGTPIDEAVGAFGSVFGDPVDERVDGCGGGWSRVVTFPGLVVGFFVGAAYQLPDGPTEADLAGAEFSSWILAGPASGWTTPEGIGIGATEAELVAAYPEAVFNPADDDTWWMPAYYSIGEGGFVERMLFVLDDALSVAEISTGFRADWCD